MESRKENNKIHLNLSNDEALVLFEWLSRFNSQERPSLFEDQAEQRLLFDLEAGLEKTITSSFQEDYSEAVLKARDKIRDQW